MPRVVLNRVNANVALTKSVETRVVCIAQRFNRNSIETRARSPVAHLNRIVARSVRDQYSRLCSDMWSKPVVETRKSQLYLFAEFDTN